MAQELVKRLGIEHEWGFLGLGGPSRPGDTSGGARRAQGGPSQGLAGQEGGSGGRKDQGRGHLAAASWGKVRARGSWPSWRHGDPGGSGPRCQVGGAAAVRLAAASLRLFTLSPARTAPVLPGVTLPLPGPCRSSLESESREGPGGRRWGWGAFPLYCFHTQIKYSVLSKGVACSLQGGASLGPGVRPCPVESKSPHPHPQRDKPASFRGLRDPPPRRPAAPAASCDLVTQCPGTPTVQALPRTGFLSRIE